MTREQWTEDFFQRIEELGFFDQVEEDLPPEFTLVYEIARILEDPDHPLARSLAPALELTPVETPLPETEAVQHYYVPIIRDTVDYEPNRMRFYHEIQRIFPYQFLAPPEVFDRRLAERSFFVPRTATPKVRGFHSEADQYAPDPRKQKVYLLLDTSASMRMHYRFFLAKAIAYIFLRRNMRELGEIYFRNFDIEVGPLFVARDQRSFRELLSRIVRWQKLGRGTLLAKALRIACEDIHKKPVIAGAEILVITDGAVHLDPEEVQQWLGEDIVLNTIKIGRAHIELTEAHLQDLALTDNSEEAKLLRKLQDRIRDLEIQLRTVSSDQRRRQLQRQLQSARRQLSSHLERLRQKLAETYGREIEQLSTVFVEVDDIDPHTIFRLTPERIAALQQTVALLQQRIAEFTDAELLKQAALLYDHLLFLMPFNEEHQQALAQVAQQLEEQLQVYLHPATGIAEERMAQFQWWEQKQLKQLLKPVWGVMRKISLGMVVRFWWAKLKRFWRLVRQRWKLK